MSQAKPKKKKKGNQRTLYDTCKSNAASGSFFGFFFFSSSASIQTGVIKPPSTFGERLSSLTLCSKAGTTVRTFECTRCEERGPDKHGQMLGATSLNRFGLDWIATGQKKKRKGAVSSLNCFEHKRCAEHGQPWNDKAKGSLQRKVDVEK